MNNSMHRWSNSACPTALLSTPTPLSVFVCSHELNDTIVFFYVIEEVRKALFTVNRYHFYERGKQTCHSYWFYNQHSVYRDVFNHKFWKSVDLFFSLPKLDKIPIYLWNAKRISLYFLYLYRPPPQKKKKKKKKLKRKYIFILFWVIYTEFIVDHSGRCGLAAVVQLMGCAVFLVRIPLRLLHSFLECVSVRVLWPTETEVMVSLCCLCVADRYRRKTWDSFGGTALMMGAFCLFGCLVY